MQGRRFRIGATVPGNDMQLRDGHIQGASVSVLEMQEFHLAVAQIHVDQTLVATYAVLSVNDRVTLPQFRQIPDHRLDVAGPLLRAAAASYSMGLIRIQVVLGQECQAAFGQLKAAGQWRNDHTEMVVLFQKLLKRVGAGIGPDSMFGQHLHQGFAAPWRIRTKGHACSALVQRSLQLGKGVVGTACHRNVRYGREFRVGAFGGERQACERLQMQEQGVRIQEKHVRWQDRALTVAFQELRAAMGVLREAANGLVDITDRDGQRISRQIVEQGGGFIEEQGKIIFHSCERDAIADVLIGYGARRVSFAVFPKTRAKAVAGFFIHRKLAARQQLHFLDGVQAALAVYVETAYGFDLVVEQVNAIGQYRAHREQVYQAPANTELTRSRHLRDV